MGQVKDKIIKGIEEILDAHGIPNYWIIASEVFHVALKFNLVGSDSGCQGCNIEHKTPEHTCPKRVELDDDEEFRCNCCDDCREECAGDI